MEIQKSLERLEINNKQNNLRFFTNERDRTL